MFKFIKSLRLASVCALLLAPLVQADIFDGEDLRDPTRPVGAVRPAGGTESGLLSGALNNATGLLNRGYNVSFIRAGGNEPVAMINEQLVKAGDMIGDAEVVAIEADSVSLRVSGIVQRVSSFDGLLKSKVETPQ